MNGVRLMLSALPAAAILGLAAVLLQPVHGFSAEQLCGLASYYGTESGSRTANGEHFDGSGLTAASRTLPFGTRLRITYRGRHVDVRINDRGPYVPGRILDLSRAAAARLGLIPAGVATVCFERIG